MAETQGKGPYYEEGRVEKATSRANEQGKAASASTAKKADQSIESIKDQTRKDIKKSL